MEEPKAQSCNFLLPVRKGLAPGIIYERTVLLNIVTTQVGTARNLSGFPTIRPLGVLNSCEGLKLQRTAG